MVEQLRKEMQAAEGPPAWHLDYFEIGMHKISRKLNSLMYTCFSLNDTKYVRCGDMLTGIMAVRCKCLLVSEISLIECPMQKDMSTPPSCLIGQSHAA